MHQFRISSPISQCSVPSVLPHMQPRFLISREEIQPENCFDIVGQSPGKPFCSATKGVLDSEQRLLSYDTSFDHDSEKNSKRGSFAKFCLWMNVVLFYYFSWGCTFIYYKHKLITHIQWFCCWLIQGGLGEFTDFFPTVWSTDWH